MERDLDIALIWLGRNNATPPWSLGDVFVVEPTVRSVASLIEQKLAGSKSEAWLFWDGTLGSPDPDRILRALELPGDLWHAGLKLGMAGLPSTMDYVAPSWMLNRDPDPNMEATSWRLTLRCCLVKTDVLRQMGGLCSGFKSLDAAGLEMGHRFATKGVITRHTPWLIPDGVTTAPPDLPLEDELRFILHRYGMKWMAWSSMRRIVQGVESRLETAKSFLTVARGRRPAVSLPYVRNERREPVDLSARVSVIIPTVDRYPYLYAVLEQLRHQTIQPFEIIVIDQTDLSCRQTTLEEAFRDLPLTVIYQDNAGQCSSRNAGLQSATGEYILFLDDDDDELPPTLIESHLRTLTSYRADASSGVVREAGVDRLPENFSYVRVSDVFPTNNTLVRRTALFRSGLFDLAYDRGVRADGDLGMRTYLTGALMVLNPQISVVHHRAASGGLRKHKARVITYAASKKSVMIRHLPNPSEAYLLFRFFTPGQVNESMWLRIVGTLFMEGSVQSKVIRFVIGLVLLPATMRQIRKRYMAGREMLGEFPKIPLFEAGHQSLVEEICGTVETEGVNFGGIAR